MVVITIVFIVIIAMIIIMISAVKFGAKVFSEKKTSIFSEVAYVCILLTKVEENIKQFVMKLEHLVSTHCLSNSGD